MPPRRAGLSGAANQSHHDSQMKDKVTSMVSPRQPSFRLHRIHRGSRICLSSASAMVTHASVTRRVCCISAHTGAR